MRNPLSGSGPSNTEPYTTIQNAVRALFRWRWYGIHTRLHGLLRAFSPAERALLYVFSIVLAASSLALFINASAALSVEVPTQGGSIHEGVIGTPRFINPLLATSVADRDIARLVYSGLTRATADGTHIPDLAESFSISEDGLSYTFMLREDAQFHDGTPVTARDVAFTINLVQTPEVKSPKRVNWEGVGVQVTDDHAIVFTLPRPYAPFIENTTLGILPERSWQNVSPNEFAFHQLNARPIGSGPYMVSSINTDSSGVPTRYKLRAFEQFTLGKPHIRTFIMSFFSSEDELLRALRAGSIDSAAGITSSNLDTATNARTQLLRSTLPRVFAVFLNHNEQEIFADKAVRRALNAAIDKDAIIEVALGGYGVPLYGPVPPNVLAFEHIPTEESAVEDEDRGAQVRTILGSGGWELDTEEGVWKNDDTVLSFSLTTGDSPELIKTAEEMVRAWNDVGIQVELEIATASDINTNVIRPRSYEALLFGEIVGQTLDFFAFWHSSQRSDPGLNIALYTNSDADKLLSDARAEIDRVKREEKYAAFDKIVREDMPAIFLYAPDFLYLAPKKLSGAKLAPLTTPDERFLNIHEWHLETKRVWEVFN